ncbi:7424_t:CDS:1 [Funneliformis caledonium]|uniref:Succinate dehydrogenase assembly factor 3 n=2 Tax=Funneliformis TaxID=1117308 RepID=A0A9N9C7D1_9GLOM|nr:10861_t:CDS:1 [Funneliformis mosseae]CAG8589047.1 7424_t:CDS:1 [Funneliformis caledonium]
MTLISQAKSLFPPLILYRKILRSHRSLPPSLRSIGDNYVKAEFRRHKDITNPIHIVGFLDQWQAYLDVLETQINSAKSENITTYGKKIDSDKLERFNDQQLGQLYELRKEAKAHL